MWEINGSKNWQINNYVEKNKAECCFTLIFTIFDDLVGGFSSMTAMTAHTNNKEADDNKNKNNLENWI